MYEPSYCIVQNFAEQFSRISRKHPKILQVYCWLSHWLLEQHKLMQKSSSRMPFNSQNSRRLGFTSIFMLCSRRRFNIHWKYFTLKTPLLRFFAEEIYSETFLICVYPSYLFSPGTYRKWAYYFFACTCNMYNIYV